MSDHLLEQDIAKQLADRDTHLHSLWRMTPTQRVAAMRRDDLSLTQCCAWAARRPEEIPLTNGEFEFLAAYTPEVIERESR